MAIWKEKLEAVLVMQKWRGLGMKGKDKLNMFTVQFQLICQFHDFFTFSKNLKKSEKSQKNYKSGEFWAS